MAEGCDGILEAIDSVTRHFQGEALSYARHVGQYLIELKAQAKKEGKPWGELCERLPFSRQYANRFIAIASNEALKDGKHAFHLPADQTTLYTIARLPAPEVEKHIKAGRITPTMTRTEAAQLVKGDKPKPKPAKKSAPPPPTADQPQSRGDGLRIAHQAIQILYKIPLSDGLRLEGFQTVVDWIDANSDGEVQSQAANARDGLLGAFKKAHPSARWRLVEANLEWFRKAIEEAGQ